MTEALAKQSDEDLYERPTRPDGYERPFDVTIRDAQFNDLAAYILSGIRDAKSICAMMNITRRRMDLLVEDPAFDIVYNDMREQYSDDWKRTLAEVSIDPVARSQMIHVKGQQLLATTIERLAKRIDDDSSADGDALGTTAPELRAAIAAAKVAMEGAHATRGIGNDKTAVGVQVNVPIFVPSAEQAKVLATTTREMDEPLAIEPGEVRVIPAQVDED